MKPLILVADDAGFPSVDRGIRRLAEATGKPVSAEFLIEEPGAIDSARRMMQDDLISIGIHFEITGMSDADRYRLSQRLHAEGSSLAQQPEIRTRFIADVRRQLAVFRDGLAIEPAHVSTHGNPNAMGLAVMPWWRDLMHELFEGRVPPMQLDVPPVRHNLYKWNTPEYRRAPMDPEEFSQVLAEKHCEPALELVLHPALHRDGDRPINMLFDEHMRRSDLEAAISIINAGVIDAAGFTIVPVSNLSLSTANHE